MNQNLVNHFNQQIQMELESAYTYMDMERFCKEQNLNGFAHFFHIQAQEERDHAYLIINFLHDSDQKVILKDIKMSAPTFTNMISIAETFLKHEKMITDSIHQLAELVEKEKQYRARPIINWFINEQNEEEANAREMLDYIKLIGETPNALFQYDRFLATTSYSPTTSID